MMPFRMIILATRSLRSLDTRRQTQAFCFADNGKAKGDTLSVNSGPFPFCGSQRQLAKPK